MENYVCSRPIHPGEIIKEEVEYRNIKQIKLANKYNKPVIVMEPVKGGTLVNLPPEAVDIMKEAQPELSVPSWAIRFSASLENVMVVLSGMSNYQQVDDNTAKPALFTVVFQNDSSLRFYCFIFIYCPIGSFVPYHTTLSYRPSIYTCFTGHKVVFFRCHY